MRLTKYEPNDESMFPYKLKDEELSTELDSVHKLGQLEDILEGHNIKTLEELDSLLSYVKQIKGIEEELHIDFITLFKVLKQGYIWVREHNTGEKEIVYERIRLNVISRTLDFVEPREEIGRGRFLIDYGYSWALIKEELLCD